MEIGEETRLWLALQQTPQLGHVGVRRLLDGLQNIRGIFGARLTELEACGVKAQAAQAIAFGASLKLADKALEAHAKREDLWLIGRSDASYPAALCEIYDPPPVLWGRGNRLALMCEGLAVVGTRSPTPYGLGMAERLSCDLAARGLGIFSGLARGVDAAAHRGALLGKGRTTAVLGTGVDVIYPRENAKLAEAILAQGGAIVSEFAPDQGPRPENFPVRNRIISGLSWAVLVCEAGEHSGTRITARNALEQGREVFAVPGNVTNKLSWGPNTLIKQGAHLVATWEDVWEELPSQIKMSLTPPSNEPAQTAPLFGDEAGLSDKEKMLYNKIPADQALQIDELMLMVEEQLSSAEVFSLLFQLEISGKIRQLPGKQYVRVF